MSLHRTIAAAAMNVGRVIASLALLMLVACGANMPKSGYGINHNAADYLHMQQLQQPLVERFQVCAEQGCDSLSTLNFGEQEWGQIKALFQPAPTAAEQERKQIARAVALMETLVGSKNGTLNDRSRNSGLFSGYPQLDCVAESANTTVTLMLLQQQGVLQYHQVIYPYHRGFFSFQAAHYSAAIEEINTQRRYAVDSWFFANGELPVIVPAQDWKEGYDPG